MVSSPFPVTQKLRDKAAVSSGSFIVFVIAIGFALIPASIISYILAEREKNLKHMQLVSGMNLSAYWISNYCFDIIKAEIPCCIVIGLIYAFDLKYDDVWTLFLMFPIGVVPFTYASSFLFSGENVAQTVTIFLHFVFAGIGGIVVFILRVIDSTYTIGDKLLWVLKVVPSFCLTNSVMWASSGTQLRAARPTLPSANFDIANMGGDLLLCGVHFLVWTVVLLLLETGSLDCLKCWGRKQKSVPPRESIELDEDVTEEERRVEATGPGQLKVRVNKFRKVYAGLSGKALVAVERASFGLDFGECFALLGVNGAGKTTTFKSLTNDI